jgi:hypothetical protein
MSGKVSRARFVGDYPKYSMNRMFFTGFSLQD